MVLKDKERIILNKLNNFFLTDPLTETTCEYCRYDASNKNYILEIKYMGKFYKGALIEFDKFSYNIMYSKMKNKQFIYAARMENKIYIFNVTKLLALNYDFDWTWRDMPLTTNFKSNKRIQKLIGYIDINKNVKECNI